MSVVLPQQSKPQSALGALTLTAANSYTGGTTLSSGQLTFDYGVLSPSGGTVGNIVNAVYSAIIREIAAKGKDARFRKTGPGLFAANA